MNVNISIKNISAIKSALKAYPKEMARNLSIAIRQAGVLFHARAMTNSPFATGFLRSTHELVLSPTKAEITPTANYAGFVHGGTRFMSARPWLKWTKDETERDIQDLFEKAVRDTLDNTARKAK